MKWAAMGAVVLCLASPSAAQCNATQHQCGIHCTQPCDGFIECPFGDDETEELCRDRQCKAAATPATGDDLHAAVEAALGVGAAEFKCKYGACVPASFVCNGLAHCWDKSDETAELCANKRCGRRDFRCTYGACIRRLWTCNGDKNCVDGSDETEELCRTKTCRASQFKCDYGGCILKHRKCDGTVDCHDASDESEAACGPGHQYETPSERPPPGSSPTQPPVTPQQQCTSSGRCSCPAPNQHLCMPCDQLHRCGQTNDGVCNIRPAARSTPPIKIEVLKCGATSEINLAMFERDDSSCARNGLVPVDTVALASCWGTLLPAVCRADGLWHPYKTGHFAPSKHLCQISGVNPPICGIRPRYGPKQSQTLRSDSKPQWPWLAALHRRDLQINYKCTATIVSPHFLLTAGHCVTTSQETQDLAQDRIFIERLDYKGNLAPTHYEVEQIFLHPSYRPGKRPQNDVALVKLEQEIIFSADVYPACVLTQGDERVPRDKLAATFNRTGTYQWDVVLHRYDDRCLAAQQNRCANTIHVDDTKFCGISIDPGKTLPQGSSGGPYLVNKGTDAKERWAVAGVVSSFLTESSCTSFTTFASLAAFWPWVQSCVSDQSTCATA